MKAALIEKRVKLHDLIKSNWQTITELYYPRARHFEYKSSLGIIRVYEEYKLDNTLYLIKLRWIKGSNKGKRMTCAEIDNLIKTLSC